MSGRRLALWWVDRYTRGLDAETRSTRRAEIDSDVWEQHAALGEGAAAHLAVLSRCLRGVPADISWRRAHDRAKGTRLPSRGTALRGLGWALAGVSYAFLAGTLGWGATPLVGLDLYGEEWEQDDVMGYAAVCAALLGPLAAGTLLLWRLPRTAVSAVAAGALAAPVVIWWLAPVYGPAGLAVTAAAVVLARRRRRAQALASSAAS